MHTHGQTILRSAARPLDAPTLATQATTTTTPELIAENPCYECGSKDGDVHEFCIEKRKLKAPTEEEKAAGKVERFSFHKRETHR